MQNVEGEHVEWVSQGPLRGGRDGWVSCIEGTPRGEGVVGADLGFKATVHLQGMGAPKGWSVGSVSDRGHFITVIMRTGQALPAGPLGCRMSQPQLCQPPRNQPTGRAPSDLCAAFPRDMPVRIC